MFIFPIFRREYPGKTVEIDNLIYLINEDKTSSVVDYKKEINEQVIIPRSIEYESEEYIVKSIKKEAFKRSQIKSIQFPKNSECQAIEDSALLESKIQSLSIPSSVIDLQDGWCDFTNNLIEIHVDANNPRYAILSNIMIIGKSVSIEQENYDILVFCARNVTDLVIPSFIEIIGPFCFDNCEFFEKITFLNDSKLRIIDEYSFYNCSFESINLPCHVTSIGKRAFLNCKNLSEFNIPENSELKTIKNWVFGETLIKSIFLPASLVELDDEWVLRSVILDIEVDENNPLYSSYDDDLLIGKSSIEQEFYDELVFCTRDADLTTIPSFIKKIRPNAFYRCFNLNEFNIPEDSNLQEINKNAFTACFISSISIPSHIKKICEGAFKDCIKLLEIEIPPNSKLQEIGKMAFTATPIEKISIPSSLKKICCKAFLCLKKLKQIEIPQNSELQVIESFAFFETLIESLTIPSKLINLDDGWCQSTTELTNIIVNPNNPRYSFFDNKFIIGKSNIEQDNYDVLVFGVRNIKTALIPSFIEKIAPYAFDYCQQLRKVDFSVDSKLSIIDKHAFCMTSIEKISITHQVKNLSVRSFYLCKKLKKIDISPDSNLQVIGSDAFCLTAIESFYIPRFVNEIGDLAFNKCLHLSIIEIDENSELKKLNKAAFWPFKETIVMASCKLKDIFINK